MDDKAKDARTTAAMDRAARIGLGAAQGASRLSFVVSIGGLVAALAGVLLSFTSQRLLDGDTWRLAEQKSRAAQMAQEVERARVVQQDREIAALRSKLDAAMRAGGLPSSGSQSVELAVLAKRLEAIEAEQKRMADVLANTPEKAMAVPLMRRDIDDMKVNQTQFGDTFKREIDRIYDLIKLTGGALAVGLLGLVGQQLLARRETPKP